MTVARPGGYTATQLTDGRVLVAGGFGESGALDTVEIYDPSTGGWSSTGSMTVGRSSHTATLLHDGSVLVVGGYSGIERHTSVEIYDPLTATWSSADEMEEPRLGHTATLLADGRVLVAGGLGKSQRLNTVEIYDPDADTWFGGCGMTRPRQSHTATLLRDGRVLVLGGYSPDGLLPNAEVYDPATDSWSFTGSTTQTRLSHTATLLVDGRVFVAGRAVLKDPANVEVAPAEVYDPSTNVWVSTAPLSFARLPGQMLEGRRSHTATLLGDGTVLVAGGGPQVAEVYDPSTAAWSSTGSMAEARSRHTATLLTDGRVLVAGGPFDSAELYDPSNGTWSSTGSMAQARREHTVTRLTDGRVLIAGGAFYGAPYGMLFASVEVYDPSTGTWSLGASFTEGRVNHTATLLADGRVLVVGGYGGFEIPPPRRFMTRPPVLGHRPAAWRRHGSGTRQRYSRMVGCWFWVVRTTLEKRWPR